MSFLNDRVLDNGLSTLTNEADALHICIAEPGSYEQAVSVYSLGQKTQPPIGAPVPRKPSGRKVVVSAFADGDVSSTGTATSFALVDTGGKRLLAAGPLMASQDVIGGNTFRIEAFEIGIPGPV